MRWIGVLILFNLSISNAQSQEQHHTEFKHHRLAVIIGHTHVPKGFQSSKGTENIIVPSWGFNYDYWINSSWAIGLHVDMEISTYVIEDNSGSNLERERPYIIAIVGSYNPWKGLLLGAGFGKEIETHQNFWVYRFGLEYGIELPHDWDLEPALVWDIKGSLYDSWTIGIGIGKRF